MPRILQSPAARLELLQIFNEIAAENLPAAERMIERFDSIFRNLAVHPEMAEQVPRRRRKNIRRIPVGNYIIYYRPIVDGVEILHIWHGARGRGPKL